MKRRELLLAGGAVIALSSCSSGGRDRINIQAIVDYIIVDKSARKMYLFQGSNQLKEYNVDLGFAPRGHKHKEGDGRTPEGRYRITHRNYNSSFYLSLGISYPNEADIAFARANNWNPGGDIFIHGQPNNLRDALGADWTAGCIAVSNAEMKEIFELVAVGAVIDIRP